MRDLEIRGTGDILGTRQHGHIAAVGFHLYTRLLAEAVRRLRSRGDLKMVPGAASLISEIPPAISVDLPLSAGLPADYVPDKTMRLRLYRRLADTRTLGEVNALAEEFNDRFGPPPEPVKNLLFQLKARLLAEKAGVTSLSTESGQLVLRFNEGLLPSRLPDLGPRVRAGRTALWIPYESLPEWQDELLAALEKLGEAGQVGADRLEASRFEEHTRR
jgi:transcription-repair coupling factor (superfamily II helicase)